jgi:hypothetical protein
MPDKYFNQNATEAKPGVSEWELLFAKSVPHLSSSSFKPFMSVNVSDSVELEILQVGDKLNEQSSGSLANLHAVFQVAYIGYITPH